MQMMYNVVAQAIKSMQLDAHPQDYLNFYCLGKREDVPFKMNASFADEKVFFDLLRQMYCRSYC